MLKTQEIATRKGGKSRQHRKNLIFVLCMLAIPFANFLVFWLWPNFRSILIAFKVPTIEGKEMEVTIPKGTQFGEVLKVQGNGMPKLGKKGFGDLLINVKIEVLKKPTAKQKELLEALAAETGGKKSFFKDLFK